jgi:hypothetical protein
MREGAHVMLDSYDLNNNSETGYVVTKTLDALNNNYTYIRRNPPNGGRKRKRRSKRRKSIRRRTKSKTSKKY